MAPVRESWKKSDFCRREGEQVRKTFSKPSLNKTSETTLLKGHEKEDIKFMCKSIRLA